jgi:hypothetical protein
MTDSKSIAESKSELISPYMIKRGSRVKPKFFKLLGSIMNSHMDVFLY